MARFIYSLKGITLTGVLICAFLQLNRQIVVPILIMIEAFFLVSTVVLVRREGLRLRNFFGVILILTYIAENLVCIVIPRLLNVPGGFRLWLEMTCGYFDVVLVGTVVMGMFAALYRPAYDKDFLIILGCSISKDGGLRPLIKQRTNRAIKFAWAQEIATGKPARYVPSGGQGKDEIISEGLAMEMYLLSHGAEEYEVLPEKESTNTLENLVFSRRIIDKEKKNAKTAFVTSNYHVLRSGMIARRQGFDIEGVASPVKWYFSANASAREFFAIHHMYRKEHFVIMGLIAVVCLVLSLSGFGVIMG